MLIDKNEQKNVPVEAIPCHSQFINLISEIAATIDDYWYYFNTFTQIQPWTSNITFDIEKMLALHRSYLTNQQIKDCFLIHDLMQKFESGTEGQHQIKINYLNDNLDLINLSIGSQYHNMHDSHKRLMFSVLSQTAMKLIQEKTLAEAFIQDNNCYSKFLEESSARIVLQNINLNELANDKRSVDTIVRSRLNEDEMLTTEQMTEYLQLGLDILIFKTIHSQDDFRKMIQISLKALNIVILTKTQLVEPFRILSTMKGKNCLPEIYKLLRATKDFELAKILLTIIKTRLSLNSFSDHEMCDFYLNQIEVDEASDNQSEFIIDNCYLYQLFKQLMSIRCVQTGFDNIQLKVSHGIIDKQLMLNPRIQFLVYQILCQQMVSQMVFKNQKHLFLRKKCSELLYDYMMREPLQTASGIVIHQSIFLMSKLFTKQSISFLHATNQVLLDQTESLVGIWIQRLQQTIDCPSYFNNQVAELSYEHKTQIIGLIINFFNASVSNNKELDQNFGQRIIDSNLLKPLVNINGDDNSYMIISYINLVSEVIDNYIHLIQQMLNPTVSGSELGIINHILNYLAELKPYQQTNQLGKPISIFCTVTKFLGLLAITEQGSIAVKSTAGPIIQRILEQIKTTKNFVIDSATERLFKIEEAAGPIRTFFKNQINEAQLIIQNLISQFSDAQRQGNPVFIIAYLMKISHKDQIIGLQSILDNLTFIDKRFNKHREQMVNQNVEPIFTLLFKPKDEQEAVLICRPEIIHLTEQLDQLTRSLPFFQSREQVLFNIIRTLVVESNPENSKLPCQNIITIGKLIKEAISDFVSCSELMQCQSFDQLFKNKTANQKFQRMMMYCQNSLITKNRYVIRNWQQQIPQLLQIAKLIITAWYEQKLTVLQSPQDCSKHGKILIKAIGQVTKDLNSYEPLIKVLNSIHTSARSKFSKQHAVTFYQQIEKGFPFFMLSCIIGAAESIGMHPQGENRDRKDDDLTLFAVGESLATFAQTIQSEAQTDQLLSWCIKNQILLDLIYNMTGPSQIAFIVNNGLQPLQWNADPKLNLALQPRLANYDTLVEVLMKSFAYKSWNQFEKSKYQSYDRAYMRGRRDQNFPNVQREVTPAELEQVMSIGFSEEMASNAIRLARFNIQGAVEILLNEEPRLVQYIVEQNQIKQNQQQQATQQIEEDVQMLQPQEKPISIEEFQKICKRYTDKLFAVLLQTTDQTVIDQEIALKLITRLDLTKNDQNWKQLFQSIDNSNATFEQLKLTFQIYLLMVQSSQPKQNQLPRIENIIKIGQSMLSTIQQNTTDLTKVQESLYFLCLYINKTQGEHQNYITEEVSQLLLQLLENQQVSPLTKDLILITQYEKLSKLSSNQQSTMAVQILQVIAKCNNWTPKTQIYIAQFQRFALQIPQQIIRLLEQLLSEVFVAMNLYKRDLMTDIQQDQTKIDQTALSIINYQDIINYLLAVTTDTLLIKQVLEKHCVLQKIKSGSTVQCKPQPEEIKNAIDSYSNLAEAKQQIKSNPQELNGKVVEYDLQNQSIIDPNQVFVVKQAIKSDVIQQNLVGLVLIAQWTRVFPQLLTILKTPTYNDFANDLIQLSVKSCENRDPKTSLSQVLTEILCGLLGTNQFTDVGEFSLRYKLKSLILNAATEKLKGESKTEFIAGLEIIKCLINQYNVYEFNRVILNPSYYYDSIEYLVVNTSFLRDVQSIVTKIASEYKSQSQEQSKDDNILQLSFDCIQIICAYAQQHRQELKLYEKYQEPVAKPAEKQDEQMVDQSLQEEQPHNDIQEPMIIDQQNEPAARHEDNEDEDEGNSSDEDEEDNEEDDENANEEMESANYVIERSVGLDDSSSQYEESFDYIANQSFVRNNQNQNFDIIRRPSRQIGQSMRHGIHRLNEPVHQDRFTEAWTQQEQLAQNLLHSLYTEEIQSDQTNQAANNFDRNLVGISCARCLGRGHTSANCQFGNRVLPRTMYEVKDKQQNIVLNRISQRLDVFKQIDKGDLIKHLQENIKEFVVPFKKDDPVKFGINRQYSRDGQIGQVTFLDRRFREIIDIGDVNSLEERLRYMEEHMRRLLESEDRFREFEMMNPFFLRDEASALRDNAPVEFLRPQSYSRQTETNPIQLSDQLLQQLQTSGQVQGIPQVQQSQPNVSATITNSNPFLSNPLQNRQNPFSSQNRQNRDANPFLFQSNNDRNNANGFQMPIFSDFSHRNPFTINMPSIPIQPLSHQPDFEEQLDFEAPQGNQIQFQRPLAAQQNEEVKQEQVSQPVQQQIATEPSSFGIPNSVLLANDIDPEILNEVPEDVRAELLSTINYQQPPAPVQFIPDIVQPNQPLQPNQPQQLAQPLQPNQTQQPALPLQQDQPSQPALLLQPNLPFFQDQPLQINQPFQLNQPSQQAQMFFQTLSNQINQRDQPNQPSQPDQPWQPVQPSQPAQPLQQAQHFFQTQDQVINQPDPQPVQQVQIEQNQPVVEEAKEMGIDQDFLANLPAEIREEILQNSQVREQNLASRNPFLDQNRQRNGQDDSDIANLLATVQDPIVRQDMLLNLNQASIAALPTHLREEAQRAQVRAQDERATQRRLIHRVFGNDDPGIHMPFQFNANLGFDGFVMPPNIPPVPGRFQMHHMMNGDEFFPLDYQRGYRDQMYQRNGRTESIKTIQEVESYSTSVDQLYFKLVRNSKNLIRSNNKSLSEMIETQFSTKQSSLFTIILSLLIKIASDEPKDQVQQNQSKVRFNIVSLLSQLAKIIKNGQKVLAKQILQQLQQSITQLLNKQESSKVLVVSLVLISTLRLLVKLENDFAKDIMIEFFGSNKQTLDDIDLNAIFTNLQVLCNPDTVLNDVQQESDLYKKALSRNLQSAAFDLLAPYEREGFSEQGLNKKVTEKTIKCLTQVIELPIADTQLINRIGKILLKISKQQAVHSQFIMSSCHQKQKLVLKQIIKGLNKAVQIDDEDIDDNMSQMSQVSLHYQFSQSSKDIVSSKVQKLEVEELLRLETILKETQQDLACLSHIQQVMNMFKNTPEELASEHKLAYKNQVTILNQVFAKFKDQPNVKSPIIQVLKAHFGCIFNTNQIELATIVQTIEKQKKTQAITMQPLKQSNIVQSNKQKLTAAVFKNATEVSEQLYEFCKFCLINKDLINRIIKNPNHDGSPQMQLSSFVKVMPNILNFSNKSVYFRKEIEKMKREQRFGSVSVSIRRKEIFMESYAQLGHKSAAELKGNLNVEFVNEKGVDAGGLTRDYFIELSRAMFNPNYSLFKLSSNGVSYYPNDQSFVNPDHLNFFKFIGRIIGKALFEGQLLECYFSKPLYKMMVGDDLLFEDQQDLDDDAYRSYKWTIDNDVSNQEMYFYVDQDYFGKLEQKPLVEGGVDMLVTNDNKLDYLEKLGFFKMYINIKEQVDSFLKGFHELIPKNLVSIFSHQELELLISGLPDFNLNDLRAHTEYSGYNEDSPQVKWLWTILAKANKEEIGRFLQFVTGSSRIPLDGFKALQGMRGPQPFTIGRLADTTKLPMGHTCFNKIDLPEYSSYAILKEKLLYAINETGGFELA